MKTYLTAQTVLTPTESLSSHVVTMEDGVIQQVAPRAAVELPANAKVVDLGDVILAPGYIDIHVHGGAGNDFMRSTPDEFAATERFLAKHGVTGFCLTTVTAPREQTEAALDRLGKHVIGAQYESNRAYPVGVHLEGPFLSHAKRGVHPPASLLEPTVDRLARFVELTQDKVVLVTIAPELQGATETIAYAKTKGIRMSLGHSDADTAQATAGVEAGATHATHTFNAMRTLDHRNPGILGVALSDDRLTAEIIADGIHVEPEALKVFFRSKGYDRAVLVTDGMSAAGMPDGIYDLGGLQVSVANNVAQVNGTLAGSVLTLDRAVRNAGSLADVPLERAVAMVTLNPARVLGIDDKYGSIAAGKFADFTVLTKTGEIVRTIVRGQA